MPAQKLLKPRRDLTGKTFGKLTVVKFSHYELSKDRRKDFWDVNCECGNTKKSLGNTLVSGGVQSCGCLLKESYKTLGERTRKRNLLPKSEASFNTLLSNYKDRAKKKKLKFSLSKEEFKDLISKNCEYCDSIPSNFLKKKKSNGGITYNGIDRLDNNKGYIKENCITACEICNKAKRDLTLKEFTEWLSKMIRHQGWKKHI